MSYLVCMLIIALFMAFFMRVLVVLERGTWPAEKVSSAESALRELFLGRQIFR